MIFDLHCHSFYSDGIDSPENILNKAFDNNVNYIALTDHDTIAGLQPLRDAADKLSLNIGIINGIELSVKWKKNVIHILGLNLQEPNSLDELLVYQNQQRIERAKKIAVCLEELGIQEAYQKAHDIAGHDRIGRPHFAKLLLNEGKVKDLNTAFKRYLVRGRSAFVPVNWVGIEDCVRYIMQSGGVAVIAHPLKYKLTQTKLNELIGEFKEVGGSGIEVISGRMHPNQIQSLLSICKRYNLVGSTGSDYHGQTMSNIDLGKQQQLPLGCTPVWQTWGL